MQTPRRIVALPPEHSQGPDPSRARRLPARLIGEVAVIIVVAAAVACAFMITDAWVDRHFLPDFFKTRSVYRAWETAARMGLYGLGLVLAVLVRPAVGALAARATWRGFARAAPPIILALALSLMASEMVLRSTYWHVAAEAPIGAEPKLQADPRLGWVFAPSRTARVAAGGRLIDYVFDGAGNRVPRQGGAPDLTAPTIVFAGESIMFGYGLTWDESPPGQVEAITGLQGANITVVGYSTDQALMRLQSQLPRFQRPVAVVVLFTPTLLTKNLTDDRPHLRPDLTWAPAKKPVRLEAIAVHAVPYHSQAAIDRGVAMTRAALKAIVDQAHARGAQALIVTPQFGPEEPAARALRRRILDDTGLPYVFVPLDPSWRIKGDGHPDARGARAIAEAIAARLQAAGVGAASRFQASAPAR